MADVKQNAEEEKEVDSESDSPSPTQEPSHPHTSSPQNNAPARSSDAHQSPLNGALPNPFVSGGVPAVPHAGHSLPSGALVNGPASHPTSEEPRVPNKGGRVPDAGQRPGEDASPEVSQPPGEFQSDAPKETAGPVLKALPAEKVAMTESDNSDSELPYATLAGDSPDNVPISQLWDFDSESSESSSDDYDGLNWDPQKEFMQFLLNGRMTDGDLEKKVADVPQPTSQRRRKRKTHMVERTGTSEKVYSSFSYPSKYSLTDDDSDFDTSINKEHAFRKKSSSKSPADSCQENSSGKAAAIKELILSESEGRCHDEGSDAGEGDTCVSGKPEHLKAELTTDSEQEPSFFPCTKCNVNFKEKKHLHRHMMYHLDGHNQVRHVNVPRPFICRECGRSFRDRNSLQKHMIIHQARREKLMEEIKGLNELQDEGRGARLQCPQCVFGTNCPKTFVQHAKTHEKDKRYYCCEQCNHMAVTEHELEAHQRTAHFDSRPPKWTLKNDDSKFVTNHREALSPVSFPCKICPFSTQNRNVLKKHVELIHQQPYYDDDENQLYKKVSDHAKPAFDQHRLAGQAKKADSPLLLMNPKLYTEKQAFRKRAELPFWSNGIADLYVRNSATQKARKGLNSPLFKWSFDSSTNKLSPSFMKCDKPSKLPPQPTEKIDVTTGLPYVEEDNQEYGSVVSENRTKYLSSFDVHLTTKADMSSKVIYPSHSDHNLAVRAPTHKSPSKRKMSIPYRNTTEKAALTILPKHEPMSPELTAAEAPEGDCYEDTYDFSDYTSEATANFLDSSENEQNPYARSYFIRRQRFPLKEDSEPPGHRSDQDDKLEDDSDDIHEFIVKEECIESAVSEDTPDSLARPQSGPYADYDASPPFSTERKSCPYCPATFESGVGLSNHVRGHLHRVGLSYDARHVVSAEQVASQDRQPRVRRKISSVSRRIKKADKPESQTEHTCPLCWGWFDTKTGLSNHVRGHLKRIGKPVSSTSKSPLCILNELLRDEKEHHNILQVLNRKPFLSRPFVSQKFAGSDGLFLTPTGIPVKIQHVGRTPHARPWGADVSQQDEGERRKRTEVTGPPSSTLVELLKKRRLEEVELTRAQSARKHLAVSPSKESEAGTQAMKLDPNWTQENNEINKKICIHCNTAFHSAVSLSNHLRAYARRKSVALLEGTTYDCRQKRPRPRPGPKKKMFPLPHAAPDEVYRLTCRFCDLVFQGPLSVQEDWIKHLQRHLMHTSVPRTGSGMVEVTAIRKELLPPPPPEHLVPESHSPPQVLQMVS